MVSSVSDLYALSPDSWSRISWWEVLPILHMGESQSLSSGLSSASPGAGPPGLHRGLAQREAGTQTQFTIEWPALPLTWLTVCVAEDTYSSEETVDHQPVHLRVMDTADPVTLSPSPVES